MINASFAFTAIGCALMLLFSAKTSVILLALSLGVLGFGLGANATIFMRIVLFGVPAEKAGAATGTYGLFRDLAAPFGVAVFVPLFTNSTTSHIISGLTDAVAAVRSIHTLAITELICIAVGIVTLLFLPKIHQKKECEFCFPHLLHYLRIAKDFAESAQLVEQLIRPIMNNE